MNLIFVYSTAPCRIRTDDLRIIDPYPESVNVYPGLSFAWPDFKRAGPRRSGQVEFGRIGIQNIHVLM
jgi:hypothetical protein